MPQDEVTKFFEGLPKDEKQMGGDILKPQPIEAQSEAPVAQAGEAQPQDIHKNRRHRRLELELERERMSNVALNERIRVLSELSRQPGETQEEIDDRLERIFGGEGAGKEISRLFKKILDEDRQKTVSEVLQTVEERVDEKIYEPMQEQKVHEDFIDEELENLEERFGIDLTSDSASATKARSDLLDVVEAISPKDEEGYLKEFGDFDAAFAIYAQSRPNPNARQKQLSARSMQQSGTGTTGQTADTGPMTFERAKKEINRLLRN